MCRLASKRVSGKKFHTSCITLSATFEASTAYGRLYYRMLLPCFIAISLYTVICCCVASSVRSRPWLGLGGVLSAAMAIISAVGLLLLCGYNMTSVACSMPFIIFCKFSLLTHLILHMRKLNR